MKTLDARILEILLRESKQYTGITEIAEALDAEVSAINAKLDLLEESGFRLTRHPHYGIRLDATPENLIADDIQARLENTTLGRKIYVLRETASTNDFTTQLGKDGAPHGTVVFAESQTAGRGRLGRRWQSPPQQGLWFSVLVRPDFPPALWHRYTLCTALGLAQSISTHCEIETNIKWPNDIHFEGRKLAGVLLETQIVNDAGFVVVGVGLNVNQSEFPPEIAQTATSLTLILGEPIHRPPLAASLLDHLAQAITLAENSFDTAITQCSQRSNLLGREVHLDVHGKRVTGIAKALDSEGALVLNLADGTEYTVNHGDVTLQKTGPITE